MTATFEEIDREAAALGFSGFGALVNDVVAQADENNGADEAAKFRQLESLLCYEKSAEVRAWFEVRGVRF